MNAIEKESNVRIDVNSSTGIVTINGGTKEAREEVKKKIDEIRIKQQNIAAEKEEARKLKAAEETVDRMEKIAAGEAKANAKAQRAVNPDADREDKVQSPENVNEKIRRSNEFAAVPVGMTVTAGGKNEANFRHAKRSSATFQVRNGSVTNIHHIPSHLTRQQFMQIFTRLSELIFQHLFV